MKNLEQIIDYISTNVQTELSEQELRKILCAKLFSANTMDANWFNDNFLGYVLMVNKSGKKVNNKIFTHVTNINGVDAADEMCRWISAGLFMDPEYDSIAFSYFGNIARHIGIDPIESLNNRVEELEAN